MSGKKLLAYPMDLTMPVKFVVFIHALDSVSKKSTLRRRKCPFHYAEQEEEADLLNEERVGGSVDVNWATEAQSSRA
ncbi:hypothetical protein WN51_09280 [Melipona quadrifasciata]|uniref:Uncharacterized protein n=1 Tax=Melipona quadrifasciata TaxID=166423 RepID=A0A0M9A5F9_9HYME|nr:hypothetical protein WN51_09280 [Melipona quadrifasciata]